MSSLDLDLDTQMNNLELEWRQVYEASMVARADYQALAANPKANGPSLEADGHHLISDVWSGMVALAAVTVVKLVGARWVDPVAAIAVAAFISRTGIRLIRRSAAGLMDEQDQEDSLTLERLLDAHGAGERAADLQLPQAAAPP